MTDFSYRTVFFDLDGTFHLSGHPFPGLIEGLLDYKRRHDATLVAVTNNTSVTPEAYKASLVSMGLPPKEFELCSPLNVIAGIANAPRAIFPVATAAVTSWLERAGFVVGDAAVLSTFNTELTYAQLVRACELLHAGAELYATHVDVRCPTRQGFIPDCGAITGLLEQVGGVTCAGTYGKPSPTMARHLRETYDCSHAVMVGDRLYTDIALGRAMGIDTALVLTGEAERPHLGDTATAPTHVGEDFLSLLLS